jgi:hypothetical protein
VIKYEPPIIPSQAGNLVPLPNLVSLYDIEGAERFGEQVDKYLLDAPIEVEPYLDLIGQFAIETVALNVILRDWLARRSITEASNGFSVLNPAVIREGIVIRPMHEMRNEALGRVVIKRRSPECLVVSEY